MVQATTPTFVLSVPENVDLTQAQNVYFTLRQYPVEINKTDEDMTVEAHTVYVPLSQAETLLLHKGVCDIQLNWTYQDGQRAASKIVSIDVYKNILQEVVE